MTIQNDFLQFCSTDTGTNLLDETDYLAATDRISGNKPGVASSKLNNKALRQANFIASQFAQLIGNQTGTDVLDDALPAKLLAQMMATLTPYAANMTTLTSGTGTFNPTYIFQIDSGSATAGATYTNNTFTFTVITTIASGVTLYASGPGAPLSDGTLTQTGGTGDSSITFRAVRAPLYMRVRMIGGGGAGGGVGAPGTGGNGGNTTFGSLTAGGGLGGHATTPTGGAGGTNTFSGTGVSIAGGGGGGGAPSSPTGIGSGIGGAGFFGGGGYSLVVAGIGIAGATNSGGGGGGAASSGTSYGAGGGSGGFIEAQLAPATKSYGVGAGGTGAGTTYFGGAGGSGLIQVTEYYQ